MASLFHPRYPTGKHSPYFALKCYACGTTGRGRWMLTYPDGKKIANRKDALRLKADHERQCRPAAPGAPRTFGQLMQEYLTDTKTRRNPRSQEDTEYMARRLQPYLGALPTAAVTPGLILKTLNQIQQDFPKMGLSSRDHHLVFLRGVCRFGGIPEATKGLDYVAPKQTRAHLPAEREQDLLTLAIHSKYYPGVLTIIDTGVRPPSEISRLETRDFDLTQKILTVRAEVAKSQQARYISLSDRLVEVLRGALPKEGRAFRYYWPHFQRQVRAWLVKVGVTGSQLGPYALRHGFGTKAAKLFGPFVTMALMGHRRIETTMRYVHVNRVPVSAEQMNQLSGILHGQTDNGSASSKQQDHA